MPDLERWTKAKPCPICGGHPGLPRGHGKRCTGYRHSQDPTRAFCERVESPDTSKGATGALFRHRTAGGPCDCERDHGAAHTQAPPAVRPFEGIHLAGQALAAAGISEGPPPQPGEQGRWQYRGADGGLVGVVVRTPSAKALPFTAWWTDGVASWKAKGLPFGVRWPMLNLVDLAARPDAPVLWVEGEKTADAAKAKLSGWVVVTGQGGANSQAKTDWAPLKGRAVTIWPDADPTGAQAAQTVAKLAADAGAASVAIVDPPEGLPNGWDLADDLPQGLDGLDLDATAKAAKTWTRQDALEGASITAEVSQDPPPRTPGGFRILSLADLRKLPPPSWLVGDAIPRGGLVVLYGPPGAGKSFVALDLALRVATGSGWAGRETQQGGVLYLAGEGVSGYAKRAAAWMLGMGRPEGDTPDGFHLVDGAPSLMDLIGLIGLGDAVRAELGPDAIRLVVVDTLAASTPGADENSAQDMGQALSNLAAFRKALGGAAALVVHHTGKAAGTERGSSALRGAADTMLEIEPLGDAVRLKWSKQKDAACAGPETFKREAQNLGGGDSSCSLRWLRWDEAEAFTPATQNATAPQRLAAQMLAHLEPLKPYSLGEAGTALGTVLGTQTSKASLGRAWDDLGKAGKAVKETVSGKWMITVPKPSQTVPS